MGKQNLDNLTPFQRWNALRSAVSKEVKKSGIKLQTGQYGVYVKHLYHSTKTTPLSEVISGLASRLPTATQPQHPFIDDLGRPSIIPYYQIDHEMIGANITVPGDLWIDATAINGSWYMASEYHFSIFKPLLTKINSWFNPINDSGDDRMPHFMLTLPTWNPTSQRYESVWIITTASGSSLEGFDWNPDDQELDTENIPHEEPLPELPPEPTPKTQKPVSPKADEAKAQKIITNTILKEIAKLDKYSDSLITKMERLNKLGLKDAVNKTKKEYNDTIDQISSLRKKLQ